MKAFIPSDMRDCVQTRRQKQQHLEEPWGAQSRTHSQTQVPCDGYFAVCHLPSTERALAALLVHLEIS